MMKRESYSTHLISTRPTKWIALLGALLLAGLSTLKVSGQPAPPNGPHPNPPRVHALLNARVVVQPGQSIESATILVRDGIIEAVGPNVKVPDGARIWNLEGQTVHAGFIDLSVSVAIPENALPDAPGRHWNSKVHPELNAVNLPGMTDGDREQLRSAGFTAALIAPDSGIFRGSSAFINLADPDDRPRTYIEDGPQSIAFETSGWGSDEYPSSLMGAIALIRQTFLDTQWHRRQLEVYANNQHNLRAPAPAFALEALDPCLPSKGLMAQQPVLMHTRDEFDVLRCADLMREFDLRGVIKGNGSEFHRLDEVVATGLPIILPIAFDDAPSVASNEDAQAVSLRELMQWEQAPTNPRRLINAGARVALTTESSGSAKTFFENLRRAIKEGLTEDQALAALTTEPAKIVGLDQIMGTVEPGKVANLVVLETPGELFARDRKVRTVWVDGTPYQIEREPVLDPKGTWEIVLGTTDGEPGGDAPPEAITMTISGKPGRLNVSIKRADASARAKSVELRENRLAAVVPGSAFDRPGWERLAAIIRGGSMHGTWETADGRTIKWSASRTASEDNSNNAEEDKATEGGDDKRRASEKQDADENDDDESKDEEHYAPAPEKYPTPLGAFGRLDDPFAPAVIFVHNATIWTGGSDGIIENGDLILRDGRIEAVGKDLAAPDGAYMIDATGKHVTAGLIDCHSHTGIARGSINEGTEAITAEVRIQDVIDPDDINWYRQLAGGLTAVNQLHGSANPIGGQNSVVKLRWGASAEDFKLKGAIPGIKFALGENVKQSNWGDRFTTRYPQSRMGVEQIMRSAFDAARDYEQAWSAYNNLSDEERAKTYPPRRDLELDALLEILRGERIVHCHSYRQDEILMLLRVAEDFGFRIGTLQHILEGYKVAKEIAEHGAGASAFSDWWAYKIEVYDAIPYAGSIMHDVGVLTSFNSDSSELARRMNLEAAKAIKYGDVPREEALNFVALNPAKQLRIDDRVGSIEVGKDADFVVWSGDPLSTFTRCEQTWIDGKRMFSLEEDAQLREYAANERQRIIQKILVMDLGPDEKKEPKNKPEDDESDDPGNASMTFSHWHRNQLWNDMHYNELLQNMGRGVCGCGLSESLGVHEH